MLGKLIKYEIPALGRKLVPLYIAWAATAVLLGVAIGNVESKSEFIMVLSGLLYAGVATAVFVMGVVMVVQRYSSSLLGDEGYFYHALPVTASEHIASKTISAVVWVLLSFVAMAVTGILIAIFGGALPDLLKLDWVDLFRDLFRGIDALSLLILLEVIIAGVLSIAKSILAIYAALAIGHQAQRRTSLASIGAYLAILAFESIVGRICFGVFPHLVRAPGSRGEFALLMLAASVVTILIGGFYFFICKTLMENKLDLN